MLSMKNIKRLKYILLAIILIVSIIVIFSDLEIPFRILNGLLSLFWLINGLEYLMQYIQDRKGVNLFWCLLCVLLAIMYLQIKG